MPKALLSDEEFESLADFAANSEFLAAINKEMDDALRDFERKVLTYSLQGGDERELVRIKCRAEGAASYAAAMRARLEAYRKKGK